MFSIVASFLAALLLVSPYSYSGPLSETLALGNVAYRAGKKLEWDPVHLKATNAPDADKFIQGSYRLGWELDKPHIPT